MKSQSVTFLIALCYILQLFTVRIGYSYTFNGYELRDLTTYDTTFETDAAQWTASNKQTTNIWSKCAGTYLLGGAGVLGTATVQLGEYFQRVYTDLPAHSMIHYTFTFWAIDSWDLTQSGHDDGFYIMFDSTKVDGWKMSLGWFTEELCGVMDVGWKEARDIRIFGTVPHTKSTLTFQVVSDLNEVSGNESFGFRDIVFVFDQSGTASTGMCGSASSVNLPNSKCLCPEGQYYDGSSCQNCHANCASCYGSGASNCYECKKNTNVFWDGTSCITCAAGCSVCNGPDVKQCLKCSSGYSYFAWINECVIDCQYPLVKGTDASGNSICSSPCAANNFILWDRSCSTTCPAPLQQRTLLGVIKLCRYPCTPVEYLYWDGSCQQDCWDPLTVRVEKGAQYCDYKCSPLEFLKWDGNCAATCEYPFISRVQNGRQFCHPPCSLDYYFYPDNTCLDTCTGGWTSRTETGGVQYCEFNCADAEFYYWDGRCLTECDFPLKTRYEHGKAFCDYLTDVNNYLYWDGTSSATCDTPILTPRTEGTPSRKYCDYGCNIWDYRYWDGACVDECNFPLLPKVQNGRKFCDFKCTDPTDHLYWNGSCVPSTTGCNSPFISRHEHDRDFCDSAPTLPSSGGIGVPEPETFYYWDGTSAEECETPLIQRIEGTTKYCDFKCTNPSDYLYWNGSCINSCDPPLVPDPKNAKLFCKYKCTADQSLHTNGTCLDICDSPYIQRTYGTNKFCFDFCTTSTDFYHWNNTCHSDCPLPHQKQTIGSLNWCIYPCLTNQFLLNDGSCIETCDLPLTAKIELGYKYCINPCDADEYLFWNGSCMSSCDAPLRTLTENICILPCDNPVEYYDEQTGTCRKECDSPSLNSDDMYLRCLPPKNIIYYGTLLDIFIKTPEPGATTLVTVPSGLQYIRYLGMPMPARLSNFTISQGRNILSLRFGQRMSEDMITMFEKRTLAESVAEKYMLRSNFIVNFWEELSSLTIAVTAAMFLTIFEQIFKARGWTTLHTLFEKLKIIARWNFCLILIATSVGNIIFFASVEFKSSNVHSSFFALSLELCLVMIGAIIALLIAVVYLTQKLQLVKRKCIIYNTMEEFEKFQKNWQGYQVMFRGFRHNNLPNQTFYMIYIIRLALPMIIAASLSVSSVTQTVLYIIITLAILFYILHQKPLIRRINHIQLIIVETITLVINCCLFGMSVLDVNDPLKSHMVSGLGDLIVGLNSTINLVAIVFLFIKVIGGIRTIYNYQKNQKVTDRTVYLQVLTFMLQQGGMGFEEVFVSEEAARIFNQPDKLIKDKKSSSEYETVALLQAKSPPSIEKQTKQSSEAKSNQTFKFFSMFKTTKEIPPRNSIRRSI